MNDIADRLEALIPQGDGYNSEYAHTLVEAVEALRKAKLLSAEPAGYFRSITADGDLIQRWEQSEYAEDGAVPLYAHPPADELEALRRDATRYRWLKGLNDGVILLQNDEGVLIEDAADTAIDADMTQHGGLSDG